MAKQVNSASENADMSLEPLRLRIDELDSQVVALLNERARVVVQIGNIKRDGQTPIYAPDREQHVLDHVRSRNKGPLPDQCLEAIWRELMSGSFALERPLRIGYLGPSGSFSHLAARRKFGTSVEYEDLESIRGVFEDIARSHIDLGIVPIENSIDGGIVETLDSFFESPAQICAEVLVNIHHNLLANTAVNQIERVYSRPNGFSQCRQWLSLNLRQAEHIPVASTSKAAEMAVQQPQAAAIGSTLAAEIYGLKIQFANIEDNPHNTTRFFVIAPQRSPKATGDDKTAVMFATAHKTGALSAVLDVYREHGLNLTHIDKRPSKQQNWEYFFFVDFEGHRDDANVEKAIRQARKYCLQLTLLGSFPRAKEVL